ncbi:structural maintenance of chromosome 4 [Perkinsela sp. CCAP 1560/4]|nr:structural maintenance of chromosome 4 [Perkinsela sp. CCAP 1560/4]|eukprot:KNH09500.1 structural maintenance of chromosome 4 [Perkinsela sp. CCAP 1560/4]
MTTPTDPINTNSLVLEYIEVENFKSYAYKHRIGPFDETFTAVIGPNGSGKSNILDALLFVFGKRANKIRLDRLAELIHSSAGCPTFSHASVSVVFYEPATKRRITLTRVVYRHNSSTQYFIDEKKFSHTSVVSFLKDKGVDLEHNRFLILQGEVEQIALMRPKAEREGEEGFLEYLDDLIGTNRYISNISELLSKTETLQEERMTVLERTHKLGKDRELLESGKNAAISYVKKDNQMQKIVSTMCQMKIQKSEEELAPHKSQVERIESKINESKRCAMEYQLALESSEKEMKEFEKQFSSTESENRDLFADKEQYERQTQEIKSHIDHTERDEKRQNDNQKKLKDEILKIKNQIEDIDRDKVIASQNQKDVHQRLEETVPRLEKLKENFAMQTKPLQNEREQLLRALAPFKSQIDDRTREIDTLQQRIQTAQRDASRKEEDIEKLVQRQKETSEGITQLQHNLQAIEANLSSLESSQADSLPTLERKREAARERRISLTQQIEAIRRQMQSTVGDDKVTQFLETQQIQGYYGPLRNLCSINDQYDIAAGVAGGGFWSYHVVESENVAQQCISLLKKHDVGRGTFIVLSIQKKTFGDKVVQPFNPPSQTIRLYDQLRFVDDKYSYAGYFAVRDTLIAESLAVARRVGLDKRLGFRVVSCAGELVEPTGQITGGGQRRPQGARLQGGTRSSSGRSVRDEQSVLSVELEKVDLEERDIIHRLKNLRESDTNRTTHRQETQMQYQQIKANIQRHKSSLEQTNYELQELRKLAQAATAKLQSQDYQRIQKTIEKLQSEQENIANQSREYNSKLQSIERKLADFGGPEYTELQAEVSTDRQWLKDQESKNHQLMKGDARLKSMLQTKFTELREYENTCKESAIADKMAELKRKLDSTQQLVKEVAGLIQKKQKVLLELQESKRKLNESIQSANTAILSLEEEQEQLREKIKELNEVIEEKRQGVLKYTEGVETCERKIYDNLVEFGNETIAFKDSDEDVGDVSYVEKHTDNENKRFNTGVPLDVLRRQDFKQVKYLAEQLKVEIDRVRDQIDLASVQRWKEKDTLWKESKQTYDAIHEQTVTAEESLASVREQRQSEFHEAFGQIRLRLKSLYQILTQGGDADLEYIDAHDPFQGINFCVRPSKKSWKQIGQLSGGEKTLASLSFIFALHHFRPTPIYIMDEIDAALDFRNVSIVAQYVSTQAIGAQFIIISLRNSMFELANQLIGVAKVKDCTSSVALSPARIKQSVEELYAPTQSTSQKSLDATV